MEYIVWMKSEFATISAAPWTYVITILLITLLTYKICKELFGAETAAKIAQCELLQEKIRQLEGEKSTLLKRLEAHGDDIINIKSQLEKMPKIFVGENEPVDLKEGDLWVKT